MSESLQEPYQPDRELIAKLLSLTLAYRATNDPVAREQIRKMITSLERGFSPAQQRKNQEALALRLREFTEPVLAAQRKKFGKKKSA